MGGWGSGEWTRDGTKRTVESCCYLDVWLLARQGVLEPGSEFKEVWDQDYELCGATTEAGIELTLRRDNGGQIAGCLVPLTWMACHYGGKRPYFRCPGCGRRMRRLYLASGYFGCRQCHDLAYESQNQRGYNRAAGRRVRTWRKIYGELDLEEDGLSPKFKQMRRLYLVEGYFGRLQCHELDEDGFPPKPKRMRWSTYARLLTKLLEAEEEIEFWWMREKIMIMARLNRIDVRTGWKKGS